MIRSHKYTLVHIDYNCSAPQLPQSPRLADPWLMHTEDSTPALQMDNTLVVLWEKNPWRRHIQAPCYAFRHPLKMARGASGEIYSLAVGRSTRLEETKPRMTMPPINSMPKRSSAVESSITLTMHTEAWQALEPTNRTAGAGGRRVHSKAPTSSTAYLH